LFLFDFFLFFLVFLSVLLLRNIFPFLLRKATSSFPGFPLLLRRQQPFEEVYRLRRLKMRATPETKKKPRNH